MPKPTWRGLTKCVVATAWVPLVGEVFLRLLAPLPLMPRYVVAAPHGVRANPPGITYYHETPDVRVRMTINSKGVRADREIPYEKPAGVRRIVALGDSFGMGYEVDVEDTFLAVMERELNAAGQRTEVVNLSVSGHGTAEELLALRAEGFRYEPDLVIVAWHDTDLDDNVRSQLFRLADGELVRDRPTFLPGTEFQVKLARYGLYRWLSESSHLYALVRETAARQVKNLLTALRTRMAGKSPGSGDDHGSSRSAEETPAAPAALSPSEELAVALLRQMQADCAEQGAELLVLDLSVRRVDRYIPSLPHDPAGRDFGLRVVSTAETFTERRDEPLFWLRGHFHLTPHGCKIVGKFLMEAIRRHALLERPAAPGEAG